VRERRLISWFKLVVMVGRVSVRMHLLSTVMSKVWMVLLEERHTTERSDGRQAFFMYID
jgi:hypothetical protein